MSADVSVGSNETPVVGMRLNGNSGTYRITRFLGGGQTAAVYSATVEDSAITYRIGAEVAVKVMVPGLDRDTIKRFWQEEGFLIGLNQGLRNLKLKNIADEDGTKLVPSVWDRSTESGYQFLVLTLASGQALDETMRAGHHLSEVDALTIVYQFMAVLLSLHEQVHRAYLDFQPRNIFWNERDKRIVVIDWNLLSKQEMDSYRPNYDQDRQTAIRLLHRLLVGQETITSIRENHSALAAWSQLSFSMQYLLKELALPDTEILSSTRTLFERLEQEVIWQTAGSDELLFQAADILERHLKEEIDGPAEYYKVINLQKRAVALLQLAENQGVTHRMGAIAQYLHDQLDKGVHVRSHLSGGQSLLRAGDFLNARELFETAVAEAVTPEEQILAHRWRLLGKKPAEKAGEVVPELIKLLADSSGRPRRSLEASRAVESIPWEAAAIIAKEMSALDTLGNLLVLDVRTLGLAELELWIQRSQDAMGFSKSLESGQLGDTGYGRAFWYLLGDGQEIDSIKEKVRERLSGLVTRKEHIGKIEQFVSDKMTPDSAISALHSAEFRADPVFHHVVLEHVPGWMGDPANDQYLSDLLDSLVQIAASDVIKHRIIAQKQSIERLHETRFWVDWACAPSEIDGGTDDEEQLVDQSELDTKPSVETSGSSAIESVESSSRVYGNRDREDKVEVAFHFPHAGSPKAIELALHWLKKIQPETGQIPGRYLKLVSDFVEGCIGHRYTSDSVKQWLGESFPDELKRISRGINYNLEIVDLRRRLAVAEVQLGNAQRQKDRAEADAGRQKEHTRAALDRMRQEHENSLKRFTEKHERNLEKLNQDKENLELAIANLEAEQTQRKIDYKQELDEIKSIAVQEKEAELQSIQTSIAELDSEYKRLDEWMASEKVLRKEEIEHQLEQELAPLRAQEGALLERIARTESEAVERRKMYEEQIQVVSADLQTLNAELYALKQERETLAQALRRRRNEKAELRREAERYRKIQQELKHELRQMHADKRSSKSVLWEESQRLRELERQIERANRRLSYDRHALKQVTRFITIGERISTSEQFERVLVSKLLERAKTIGLHEFPRQIESLETALDSLAEIEHIYRVVAYLQFAVDSLAIQSELDELYELLQAARQTFRLRYVRQADDPE